MDSIKNAIVTVTLLVVGYGSYVVLKQPTSGQFIDPSQIAGPSQQDGSDLNISVDVGATGLSAAPAPANNLSTVLQSVANQASGARSRFESALPEINLPDSLPNMDMPNLQAPNLAATIDNAAQSARSAFADQVQKTRTLANDALQNIQSELPPLPSLLNSDIKQELPKLTSGIKDALIEAEANPSDAVANLTNNVVGKLKAEVVEPLKAIVEPPVARLADPRPTVPPPFSGSRQQLNPFDKPLAVKTNEPMPQLPNVSNWEEYEGPQIDAESLGANHSSSFEPKRFAASTREAALPNVPMASQPTNSSVTRFAPVAPQDNKLRGNELTSNELTSNELRTNELRAVGSNQSQQNIASPSSLMTNVAQNAPFERVWSDVQQRLAAKEFTKALRMLTPWSSDSNLDEEQARRCVGLLDQLAGTIIYSRDSYLQEPHTVQAGETLEEIAANFSVPQDLLAKINGIAPPYALNTGEKLKVLKGPFRATVSILNKELTLYAGAYYAGRFSVEIGRDLPPESAFYEVAEKTPGRTYFDRRLGREVIRNEADNRYGNCWLGLRGEHITTGHQVGIHGRLSEEAPTSDIGSISLSPNDAEDVFSILSIGSRIEVRP